MTKPFVRLLMALVITGSIVLPTTVDAESIPFGVPESQNAEAAGRQLMTEAVEADQPERALAKALAGAEAFRRATLLEPGNASAFVGLGDALAFRARLVAGDRVKSEAALTEATKAFKTAVKLDPRSAGAWLQLGDTLLNLSSFHPDAADRKALLKKSETALETAIQLDPDNPLGWQYLSYGLFFQVLLNEDDAALLRRAAQRNDEALKRAPSDVLAWKIAARLAYISAMHLKGDDKLPAFRASAANWKKVTDLDPKDPEGWAGVADVLGLVYIETNVAGERAALRTEVIDALTESLKLPTPNPRTVYRQKLLCGLLLTGAQGRDLTRLTEIEAKLEKLLKPAQE